MHYLRIAGTAVFVVLALLGFFVLAAYATAIAWLRGERGDELEHWRRSL